MSSFHVPMVLRADFDHRTATYLNEGFFFISSGVVIIKDDHLAVMEAEEFAKKGSLGAMSLYMPFNQIDSIRCQPFHSQGKHYRGGKVQLYGVFDRHKKEQITMKMEMQTFHPFIQQLAQHTVVE